MSRERKHITYSERILKEFNVLISFNLQRNDIVSNINLKDKFHFAIHMQGRYEVFHKLLCPKSVWVMATQLTSGVKIH